MAPLSATVVPLPPAAGLIVPAMLCVCEDGGGGLACPLTSPEQPPSRAKAANIPASKNPMQARLSTGIYPVHEVQSNVRFSDRVELQRNPIKITAPGPAIGPAAGSISLRRSINMVQLFRTQGSGGSHLAASGPHSPPGQCFRLAAVACRNVLTLTVSGRTPRSTERFHCHWHPQP